MAIAGCGREGSSQVAARVNKQDITIHQLNSALAQIRNIGEDQQKAMTKQVLERMIDQELLVQKAIENKLDRDPRVVQALDESRRQILTQAYLERVTQSRDKPSTQEVKGFFEEHPELFAERKIYRLDEVVIPLHPEITTKQLEQEIRIAKSLNDVISWLKSKNAPFNAHSVVRAAEHVPSEVLQRLAQLQVGQMILVPGSQGHIVVRIAAAEPRALDAKQAAPSIERYLDSQKRLELARMQVKHLRDAARVEYAGVFAEDAAAAGLPPAAAPAPSAAAEAANGAMDRGVGGLR